MGTTLQETPSGNRLHIGIFGKTNSGKSAFINAFSGQSVSIVADVKGTTTDPVYKAMEIAPLGPCVLIDTAGFDDEGELGAMRMEKTALAAQKTYEKKLVSYPRTGSRYIPQDVMAHIPVLLEKITAMPEFREYRRSLDLSALNTRESVRCPLAQACGKGNRRAGRRFQAFCLSGRSRGYRLRRVRPVRCISLPGCAGAGRKAPPYQPQAF